MCQFNLQQVASPIVPPNWGLWGWILVPLAAQAPTYSLLALILKLSRWVDCSCRARHCSASTCCLISLFCILNYQSFNFDLMVDIADGGALTLVAAFMVNLEGVNPSKVLQSAAGTLNATLLSVGSEFESIINANGLASGFSKTVDILAKITEGDQLILALDALIDFSVGLELSTNEFSVSSEIRALSSAIKVRVEDRFDLDLEGLEVAVAPAIELDLSVENTAVPFDVFLGNGLANLNSFDFTGSLASRVVVTMEGVPAAVVFEAELPDITNASSVEFEVTLDIDLYPIRESTFSLPFTHPLAFSVVLFVMFGSNLMACLLPEICPWLCSNL